MISEKTQHSPLPAALCLVFSLRRYVTALLIFNRRIHSFRICLSAYRGQKRKLRFPFLRVVILIISRASRITFLRQRTPFADTSAHGRGEAAALYNMRALKVAAARGKPLGFPLKIVEICFVSSKQISRVFIIPPARTVRHR